MVLMEACARMRAHPNSVVAVRRMRCRKKNGPPEWRPEKGDEQDLNGLFRGSRSLRDRDAMPAGLHLRRLRQRHGEYAVAQHRFRLLRLDLHVERDAALEA